LTSVRVHLAAELLDERADLLTLHQLLVLRRRARRAGGLAVARPRQPERQPDRGEGQRQDELHLRQARPLLPELVRRAFGGRRPDELALRDDDRVVGIGGVAADDIGLDGLLLQELAHAAQRGEAVDHR